jgi:segregation and condensation protein A
LTTDYRVCLDAFEGPLDLLLFLIRRAEVDITDIPIAAIADQYIAYLQQIDTIDIDLAGEFLVMAATLMEIKSRMLAPPKPQAEADPLAAPTQSTDPRADLVQQLLAYKKYRDAADSLEHRKHDWEQRFPVAGAGINDQELREAILASNQDVELEDITLVDLVEAFSKIVAAVNFDRLGEHQVTYDDTPIELHAADILDLLKREQQAAESGQGLLFPLVQIFQGHTRGEMLGLFLAVLELVRRRAISVQQDGEHGPIAIGLRPEEEAAAPPSAA